MVLKGMLVATAGEGDMRVTTKFIVCILPIAEFMPALRSRKPRRSGRDSLSQKHIGHSKICCRSGLSKNVPEWLLEL